MKRDQILYLSALLLVIGLLTCTGSTLTVLHHFQPGDGQFVNSLVLGNDGNFYGTAAKGGQDACWNCGYGTVFRLAPDGTFTPLYLFSFTDGSLPGTSETYFYAGGAMLQGTDGNLYGTTLGGGLGGYGTVFKITPDGLLTTLASFYGTNGTSPNSLLQARDGNFYGTTFNSGPNGYDGPGIAFRMTPDGTLATLALFDGTNGSAPHCLIQGRDGNFYGTTGFGGPLGHGTVFRMTPGGIVTILASITDTNANGPYYLMQASDGNFYGTECYGGNNILRNGSYNWGGTIFKITPQGTFTNLVLFNMSNGGCPVAPPIEGTDGNFYGTTWEGGPPATSIGEPFGAGTVFKMTPQGQITSLVQFNVRNGLWPAASLAQAADGSFYGTTTLGGTNDTTGVGYGSGVAFRLSVPGADAPKIVSASRAAGAFTLNWLSLPTRSYQLQFTTNLVLANWSNLGSIIVATNTSATASDNSPAAPKRFYRVALLP